MKGAREGGVEAHLPNSGMSASSRHSRPVNFACRHGICSERCCAGRCNTGDTDHEVRGRPTTREDSRATMNLRISTECDGSSASTRFKKGL